MYVARRGDNSLYGCWTVKQWDGQEELPDNHPEVVAFNAPKPPRDLSDIDNLDKVLKAVGLLMRDYCNALKDGSYTTKTTVQLKADFAAKYNSL